MENFLLKFKDQFIDADSIEIIGDTKFRHIGSYDSLTGMAIIVMIDDDYGVRIDDEVYKSLQTPKEIFDYINSNK